MKNITVILPIYKLGIDEALMLDNALKSVDGFHEKVKVSIVCPLELMVKLDEVLLETKHDELEIKKLSNPGETDFVSQLNLGIEDCDTEWFSILEIDDEYKKVWLPSMEEFSSGYTNADILLPIVKDINSEGKFLSFMNESVWAYGFSADQGVIDKDLLMEYQNFQTSGGLYRTQVIKDNGMFKENIKLTFSYEFFLRMANLDIEIITVPKVGYQHVNLRDGSLFWLYKHDEEWKLSDDEVKFWLETAKKEFYFKNKREIIYETS